MSCRPCSGCRQGRTQVLCVGVLDGAGYSGGRGQGETFKRWLKVWKVREWTEGDVKRLWWSSGKRIRPVRIQWRQSSGDCKDELSSHAKVFASLAPSPVAMILAPGILVFQRPRGEGMTFKLLPLQQSQGRAEVPNCIGIIFLQFLQSCAWAHYSHLCCVSTEISITLH